MALSAALLLIGAARAAPPKIERNENNVGGSMPNPAGNPAHGVLLVGTLGSAEACAAAALKNAKATSWTYHHCDFPPAAPVTTAVTATPGRTVTGTRTTKL